jgi:hypothetical protein
MYRNNIFFVQRTDGEPERHHSGSRAASEPHSERSLLA